MTEFLTIVRPWGSEWQVWRRQKKLSVWQRDLSADLSEPTPGMLGGIPARLVVAVPFWVEAVEDDTIRSIAALEVEMKGLPPGAVVRPLRKEEGRTLVRADVYPADWQGGFLPPDSDAYEPSPLLVTAGGNVVHLWREENELVAVVVWRGDVICWETCLWPATPREVSGWLRCLLLQLRSDLQIDEAFSLKEWTAVFDEVPAEFERDTTISETARLDGPSVHVPEDVGEWMPSSQQATRKHRRHREVLSAVLLGAGVLLACAIGAVFLMQWNISRQITARDAEIARLEIETASVRANAARWERMAAAVDDQYHPLEILHLVVEAMPRPAVRLTGFDMTPEKVQVEGEAQNVSAAAEYFQRLQKDPDAMPGLIWEMPPPTLQADNRARFLINGVRKNGQ